MPKDVSDIVREHNSLNGLRLVIVEFLLVTMAAAWICVAEAMHHDWLGSVAGAGIAVNAAAILMIAVRQLLNSDENIGIVRAASKAYRSRIARDHPELGGNTMRVLLLVMVPFLLVAMLARKPGRG